MAFHIVLKHESGAGVNPIYLIGNLESLVIDLNTPLTPMPLPEENEEENILVKMEGNTKTMPVSWTVKEEVDIIGSDFTHNGSVWSVANPTGTVTALDQIVHFDGLAPDSIGDSYSLAIYDDADGTEPVYIRFGSITNIRFSISGSSPVVWIAHLSFIVGNAIAAFETNSPERPTFKSVTSSVSGQAIITWISFQGYIAGEEPTLTNTDIRYKKSTAGAWKTFDTGNSSVDEQVDTITGLTSGDEYIFQVTNNNLESDDTNFRHWSKKRRVVIA